MTELEKAKLMASLIGHNERMTLCGESTVLVPNYTAAMRQALGCMNRVHGIDDPRLRALERDEQPSTRQAACFCCARCADTTASGRCGSLK